MSSLKPPQLLVSVRNPVEAEAALAGGAHVIDIKEPAHGPLGRAADSVIAAVIEQVTGRRPVSAALGELVDQPRPVSFDGLAFVKWGLARMEKRYPAGAWRAALTGLLSNLQPGGPEIVLAAYADWERAGAPPLAAVTELALKRPGGVLLIDTYDKSPVATGQGPRSLLSWLTLEHVHELCRWCRRAGVRIALAGSLGAEDIALLKRAGPTWIAVRGAACTGGRGGMVSASKVRELVELLQ
jgi:uncharacterized protein (UPF0264 family)